ncbi:MAG: class III signal peptide-containing protein [Candidatus Norongarragalinales archaeon]
MRKGQGTFEYILLLAGILLIVVLAIVLLRGGIFQTSQANIQRDACKSALVQSSSCYNADGSWNAAGMVAQANARACDAVAAQAASPACSATSVVGDYVENLVGPAPNPERFYCCGPKPQ